MSYFFRIIFFLNRIRDEIGVDVGVFMTGRLVFVN